MRIFGLRIMRSSRYAETLKEAVESGVALGMIEQRLKSADNVAAFELGRAVERASASS